MTGVPRRPLISVVTPCFNEEENLREHLRRVRQALAPFASEHDFEHIYTDNCSADRTWELIVELSRTDPAVKGLRFSRNIGANRAIIMGLAQAQGDAVILIQADLQDPPELIGDFIRGWKEGFDVVYGRILQRDEGGLLSLARRTYYKAVAALAEVPVPRDAGEFRLTSRRVLDALLQYGEDDLYLRGAVAHAGFPQKAVDYERAARAAGRSSMGPLALASFALNGLLSTTVVPIRMVVLVGFVFAVLGLALTAGLVLSKLVFPGVAPRGITMLGTLVTFFAGAQLFAIGIIGEYIRKIYIQSLRMPRGHIQDRVNLP